MRSLRTVVVLLCLALAATTVSALPAHAATNQKGTYTPLTAQRILDTRVPTGVPQAGPLGPGKTLDLQVAGRGGVPTSGVAAVVLNLTVTNTTANGYLAAYPTGGSRPVVSSINFNKGIALANIATVPLGTGGKITIYASNGGPVSVIADVMGFYAANDVPSATTGPGSEFDVVDPDRLVDTRTDPEGILAANGVLTTSIEFLGVDSSDIKALALNITAVGGTGSGYLTAWNNVGSPPKTSTLNYRKGAAVANLAVVNTSVCTVCDPTPQVQFGVYNGSSTPVHVLVDLVGVYFNDGSVSLRFSPVTPVRISDSRTPLNGVPLTPNQTQTVNAPSTVAGPNTIALVANAAVVAPTASTYLTLWAGGQRPTASNLNALAGTTAANGAFVGLSDANQFSLYNQAGTGNFIIDVSGRFDIGTGLAAKQQQVAAKKFSTPQVSSRRTAVAAR
ncbi:MAG: hypothetical protein ABWX96_22860 [Propionibacteriaceae bacterium]